MNEPVASPAADEAERLIAQLALVPHPEGGYFREVYRGPNFAVGDPPFEDGLRAASTAIYYLLGPGDFSAWHRIKSDEAWHFYAGSPLELWRIDRRGALHRTLVGNALADADAVFTFVVPAGHWFGARCRDPQGYSLVGCTVAPGFDFRDFELGSRGRLEMLYPEHAEAIRRLTRA